MTTNIFSSSIIANVQVLMDKGYEWIKLQKVGVDNEKNDFNFYPYF